MIMNFLITQSELDSIETGPITFIVSPGNSGDNGTVDNDISHEEANTPEDDSVQEQTSVEWLVNKDLNHKGDNQPLITNDNNTDNDNTGDIQIHLLEEVNNRECSHINNSSVNKGGKICDADNGDNDLTQTDKEKVEQLKITRPKEVNDSNIKDDTETDCSTMANAATVKEKINSSRELSQSEETEKLQDVDEIFVASTWGQLEPIYERPGKHEAEGKAATGARDTGETGPQSACERRAAARRRKRLSKHWDEDTLCQGTREERSAGNKGLSLPLYVNETKEKGNFKGYSLEGYYQQNNRQTTIKSSLKNSGKKILQRLSSFQRYLKLNVSTKSHEDSKLASHSVNRLSIDRDRTFFRGFSSAPLSSVQVEGTPEPTTFYSPTAPPRIKRPKNISTKEKTELKNVKPLTRSLSYTEGKLLRQAFSGIKSVEELYPDIPRSTPIYAVIDKRKKFKEKEDKLLHDLNKEQIQLEHAINDCRQGNSNTEF